VNTWKVILATLVIFGTGVVTGGLLVTHNESVQQRQLWLQNRVERNRQPRAEFREPNRPSPLEPNPVMEPAPRQPNLLPANLRMDLLQRMERQMDLTTGQREKIEEILRAGQERARQIMEPVQGELQRQVRTTRDRIRDVLTDAQKPVFDDLMRPQRRMEEVQPPGERRPPRQQPRPQEGQPRFPGPGPRPTEPVNPNQ
jgi:hypothetical protein